jgi:hypothetical protein
MKSSRFAAIFAIWAVHEFALAQTLPAGNFLLPANPTSFDSIRLSLRDTTCGGGYSGNPYQVSSAQNAITVQLGQRQLNGPGVCPPAPQEHIDIGRLPAGNYTLTVQFFAPAGTTPVALVSNFAFTVQDARTTKAAPYVRLDYSGHWWDPNDPGWGLFIWHDAKDNVLAAWFTYGADGKANWFTFQPRWRTSTATFSADMYQTNRMPGPTVPPPNPTALAIIGTASLDFTTFDGTNNPGTLTQATGDQGTFSYTIGSGPTLIRNIQRFKP